MKKAALWLKRSARPIEIARWEFLFEGGSKEQVISYLSVFQNDDGGFGHGLEPDFWSPQSSPMATWSAGQILLEIGATFEDEIVQKMLSYLLETSQVAAGMWASVLPKNNLHPHAPWWHWTEDAQNGWMFNPSVELAAFLIYWSESKSDGAELGWKSLKYAINHVMAKDNMERHEVQNYRQCLEIVKPFHKCFPARLGYSFQDVANKVQDLTRKAIDYDIPKWGTGYKALPLEFIHSSDDPLYLELKELVEENIDFMINQRLPEGAWDITWNWGQYPEEFSIARRYWQGILTIRNFKILKAYQRL